MRFCDVMRTVLVVAGCCASVVGVTRAQEPSAPRDVPDYFAENAADPHDGAETSPPPVIHHLADSEDAMTADDVMPEADEEQYIAYLEEAAPTDPKAAAALKKKKADLKKAVATAYAPLFYNNKFDYLCNPLYDDHHFGEDFKRQCLGDCWIYDLGGQYRARYHSERNHRGVGLTGVDDDFLLHRVRLFANLEIGDRFRVYAEYLDAESNYENFTPRAIEVNRSDMLNLFVDMKLYDGCRGDLKFRVGRQELLYGSERLISPLDWANTRRTFDGAKFFWQGEDWNIDFFYTKPVIVDRHNFDSSDENQEFFGTWATYKAVKNNTFDFYALQFNNSNIPAGRVRGFQQTTLGSRWLGSEDAWLWDLEGGVQFGDNTDGSSKSAGFATAGLGRKLDERFPCWKPTLWGFYDWSSGDDARGRGNGFNHQFPLAHKYLGFMDLFGRSNIQSPNVLLTMQPREKVKLLLWYYYYFLSNGNDTPYNVTMSAFNAANAPASRDLGQELDAIVTYSINPRMEILFGYSHFFAGQYYKTTAGVPFRGDADFFYTHYQWNF